MAEHIGWVINRFIGPVCYFSYSSDPCLSKPIVLRFIDTAVCQ